MKQPTRRDVVQGSILAAGASIAPRAVTAAVSRAEVVRCAVIGLNGRGNAHVGALKKLKDAQIVALCDADEAVVKRAMESLEGKATFYKDLRKLLEDKTIDVVTVATPNHWHSLASIWALQAGKHVYVEKPLSHNVFEGRKVVEAAAKYKKVVQHGTQSRSQKAMRDAIAFLHAGGLGKISVARGLCYKGRGSIGKVDGPRKPPATLDYDLWTGPATMETLMREKLHYDWHWVWNTGNGDIGNQGVHQMDLARWGLNKQTLPTRVAAAGGRYGYVDDGTTPNTQVASYDYGDCRLVFEVRGLKTQGYLAKFGKEFDDQSRIATIFHGEKGFLVISSYGEAKAYDHDGKLLQTFKGGSGSENEHFRNFLDAVKANDPSAVNAGALEGHLSSALCHLGNISTRCGAPRAFSEGKPFGADDVGNEAFDRMAAHLKENKVDLAAEKVTMGPTLTFDPAAERFTGEGAEAANKLLSREPRPPYVIPDPV
jgi:predicted dehydrogenase